MAETRTSGRCAYCCYKVTMQTLFVTGHILVWLLYIAMFIMPFIAAMNWLPSAYRFWYLIAAGCALHVLGVWLAIRFTHTMVTTGIAFRDVSFLPGCCEYGDRHIHRFGRALVYMIAWVVWMFSMYMHALAWEIYVPLAVTCTPIATALIAYGFTCCTISYMKRWDNRQPASASINA